MSDIAVLIEVLLFVIARSGAFLEHPPITRLQKSRQSAIMKIRNPLGIAEMYGTNQPD
jgi:hypothetical protein